MKILHLKLLILIWFLNPISISSGLAQENINLSPRGYCQTTGGTVTETGYGHIYICCYSEKLKCVLNNEQQGYSRLIQIVHEET